MATSIRDAKMLTKGVSLTYEMIIRQIYKPDKLIYTFIVLKLKYLKYFTPKVHSRLLNLS